MEQGLGKIQGFQVFNSCSLPLKERFVHLLVMGKFERLFKCFLTFHIVCGRHIYVLKQYKSSTMHLPVSHIGIMYRKCTLTIFVCCSALWWLQVWNSLYTVLCGLLLLLCCLHWFLPPFILYCSLKVGFNWLPTGLAWLLLLVKKKTSVFAGKSFWIEDFFICVLSIS